MRLRIVSISFLLAVASTGASWLTLQPALAALLDFALKHEPAESYALVTRIRTLLPINLLVDLVAVSGLTYLLIHYTVGRPLLQTELAIERLSRLELDVSLDSGGPLLSRLQRALVRLAEALQSERGLTRRQLDELRRSNDQLVRAQAELVATDRLATVGKLAAGVAHEVGNPLSGILGYLSLLRSRNATAEQVEMLTLIEGEVGRIDQIVRSLLDLGRTSTGPVMPLDIEPVIRAAVRLLSKSPELAKITIDVDLPPQLYVVARAGSVSQVLINLLLNSAQAMNGQGRVVIAARREGTDVLLTVADSGPGIPAEVASRLFEPFFTTKSAGKGTGLGLAVSRHLIVEAGGRLEAANRPEGGAQFTVSLPAP